MENAIKIGNIWFADFPFLVVSGIIGVGKSTWALIWQDMTGYDVDLEKVEGHPCLNEFYATIKEFALAKKLFEENPCSPHSICYFRQVQARMFEIALLTQDAFLTDRYRKHKRIIIARRKIVQDRSIYEDSRFVKALVRGEQMSPIAQKVYEDHFNFLVQELPYPRLCVYLRSSIETAMDRIYGRKREMEQEGGVTAEYLTILKEYYEEWVVEYPGQMLIIETDNIDLRLDLAQEWIPVIEKIQQILAQTPVPGYRETIDPYEYLQVTPACGRSFSNHKNLAAVGLTKEVIRLL
ncbi:MAG: deoxynucleoside kinase [Patescibacteria group bacterium]|nr:deoxynucleoside kinase [Patescibacteria group bacterium]